MSVTLHGYKFSVYAWIARLALTEKGIAFEWKEVNPFATDVPSDYLALHPFKRVPTLQIDNFVLYETSAITRFVDEAFEGPSLQPVDASNRARMNQIIAIVDNYVYWPLVRQVFGHGVMGPRVGRPSDPEEVRRGLDEAPRILSALDGLAGQGTWLVADHISLADIHLAPMISYFTHFEEGQKLLDREPRLSRWWSKMSLRKAFVETHPELPKPVT